MRYPDIIVTGVGRSGTSYIARLLQEHFKVRLAFNWDNEPYNPLGSYEEQTLLKHTYALFEKPGFTIDDWLTHYSKHFDLPGWVGIKQTPLSLCSRSQWEQLTPKIVFRTWRSVEATVASMVKWRGRDEEYWTKFYERRENCMKNNLDTGHGFPVICLYFGEKRVKDWRMIECLGYHLERVGFKL